jgi:hypothetical protein
LSGAELFIVEETTQLADRFGPELNGLTFLAAKLASS